MRTMHHAARKQGALVTLTLFCVLRHIKTRLTNIFILQYRALLQKPIQPTKVGDILNTPSSCPKSWILSSRACLQTSSRDFGFPNFHSFDSCVRGTPSIFMEYRELYSLLNPPQSSRTWPTK